MTSCKFGFMPKRQFEEEENSFNSFIHYDGGEKVLIRFSEEIQVNHTQLQNATLVIPSAKRLSKSPDRGITQRSSEREAKQTDLNQLQNTTVVVPSAKSLLSSQAGGITQKKAYRNKKKSAKRLLLSQAGSNQRKRISILEDRS